MLMNSRGGPLLGGCMLMKSRGGSVLGGCMLMKSRGGPPLGTISMDLAVRVPVVRKKLSLEVGAPNQILDHSYIAI